MATYAVKAPLVIAKNELGSDVYLYQGAPIPDGQDPDRVKAWLAEGLIEEAVFTEDDSADGADGKPAGNASLEEWQAYAVDHGMTESDLEGLSRNDIRDRFA